MHALTAVSAPSNEGGLLRKLVSAQSTPTRVLRSARCSYGREECVRLLLTAGADISATNDRNQTAAEVVKSEPRNPLNQNASLLAVLEGAAELASIQ